MEQGRNIVATQSLMERLAETLELPHTQAASVRFLKEVIRRDLEALLNTRKPMRRELEEDRQAWGTVLNYGLEDFSTLQASAERHSQALQQAIERCVAEYEPRLFDVSVSVLDRSSEKREIRLHIEAKLPIYPTAEMVYFDTVLDLASELYSVA